MYGHTIRRLAWMAIAAACAGGAQAQTARGLAVDLEATGTFTRSYAWSIDKQVTPDSADRFIGETQQLAYRITVTKGDAIDGDFQVAGTATLVNSAGTEANITAIALTYGGEPVANTCATGALAAGATRECAFTFATASNQPRPLTVQVTTTGTVAGAGDSVDVAFASPTLANASVTVTDTQLDQPLVFDDSGTHAYTGSATCTNGNTVKVGNTARIVETGASDSASARVACHALRMERSVLAQGGTLWNWDIAKSHALTGPVSLAAGASQDVTYTITATATAQGGENVVTGAITGINTHPSSQADIVSVGAAINGIEAEVECPSLVVPSASYDSNRNIVFGRLSCPFSVTLPAGMQATSVSGRITQQLFTYAPDGTATATSTRDLAGTQPISGTLGAGETDECVVLDDLYLDVAHPLGEFCASTGNTTVTRTFTGPVTVSARDECAFTVPNLARLVTNDTGTRDEAGTTVQVERSDCATGALSVDINGSGAFTRRYPWSIEKTVTPESADRFIGETQEFAYTLTLTRGEAEDAGFVVTGTANIVNGTSATADITAIDVTYDGMPVAHACATGALAAGATRTCALEFPVATDDPKSLAITVTTSGAVEGMQADTLVAFGAPVVTGETVTVSDTLLPDTLTFSDSGTHEYTHDVTCVDGNSIVVNNTATIVETGDAASATARLACHATRMERSVATFGGVDWNWDLAKTHSQTLPLQVVAGQTYEVAYTITATATASDADSGEVRGAITAINTHPSMDAVILSVAAKINGTDATVTCPTPMIAPHASYDVNHNIVVGKLVCPFTVTLAPGETPSTVTGRVEQQLFDYDSAGNATAGTTRVLQGTQPVGNVAGGSGDECVDLVDVYLGQTHDLGEFCVSEGNLVATRTFTGAITVAADDECSFEVPNLARLTTNDTGTLDEASTTVTVERTDCDVEEPAGLLDVGIEGSGAFTRHHPWTIAKSVTPSSSDRFIGETQELAYTLTLVKGEAEDAGYRVTGTATIANATTAEADITAIDIAYDGVPVVHGCTVGPLAAGETRSCALDFATATDDPKALTIAVETSGGVEGASATTMVAFGAPTVTGDSIHVDDTMLPDDLTFTASGTHEYTHAVTCVDGNTIVVDNTATIVETGDAASARARVACHATRMERAVEASGTPTFHWTIAKTHAEDEPLQVIAGQSYDVTYNITVSATSTVDGASGNRGLIEGAITAINTHPLTDAVILSVGAKINGTTATVTCPSTMIAPHANYDEDGNVIVGKLVCPFSVTLAEGEVPTTVSGRVEQQLFAYDAAGQATAAGTRVLEGTQPVGDLSAGTPIDECVTISDEYLGQVHALGEFCASQGNMSTTRSFIGSIAVTAESECEYRVSNTARLVARDTATTQEATTSVAVLRTDCEDTELPAEGCTRTQGYWRTHSMAGPAPYDPTWAQIGETTPFFLATLRDGKPLGWLQAMQTPPRGNAYWVLAPQFIAATLNTLAGASAAPQTLDALDAAQALFEQYTPGQIGLLKGDQAPRPRFIELAGLLDQYNNGVGGLGPQHCSEDDTSR